MDLEENTMYGKWSQWKSMMDLPQKMYMENLTGSWDEGLEITLKSSDDNRGIKLIFGAASIISYQSTDEGKRLKTIYFLERTYGNDFYTKWTLFEVQDSALIKWVQEESREGDDLQAKQFTLLTSDEFIDIISYDDPEIQLL